MSDNSLAEMLYTSSMKNFGSDEHLQISGLLNDAQKNVIDLDAAIEIRHFLNRNPLVIEQSLHFIERPTSPVWYEWGLETRSGHGGNEHVKTGCLVVPHDFDEHLMLVVTGWSEDGISARHAFAVALFDTETLALLAKSARGRSHSHSSNEASLSRIMSHINVTMPSGFGDEIDILTDNDPFAKERSYRDATAEIPFLLAIMILEKTRGGLTSKIDKNMTRKSLSPPIAKNRFRKIVDRLVRSETNFITPRSTRSQPVWYR